MAMKPFLAENNPNCTDAHLKVDYQLRIRASCWCFWKALFRDRHYQILNWSKRHMQMGGRIQNSTGPNGIL